MENSNNPGYARGAALVSGVVGLLAGLVLVAYFALANPYDNDPGGPNWLGRTNDALGVVQFAALAPVVWALGRRLPATRGVRVGTLLAFAASITAAVLGMLLVIEVLTFEQQIGPLMGVIIVLYGWLLVINLTAHRTRTLPRVVTRFGVLLAGGFLIALVFLGAGFVLPGVLAQVLAQVAQYLGYAVGMLGWLGLPVYVLLLAARVFTNDSDRAEARPHRLLARKKAF
jgi:hypothetical protein